MVKENNRMDTFVPGRNNTCWDGSLFFEQTIVGNFEVSWTSNAGITNGGRAPSDEDDGVLKLTPYREFQSWRGEDYAYDHDMAVGYP